MPIVLISIMGLQDLPWSGGITIIAGEEHGLSQKAVEIARVFGFPITNSMLVSWIAALFLIIFAQLATRKMEQIPSGAQNFLEWLIESLYNFLEGLLGKHLVERTFWFFATVFIFILFSNWIGLIPGVGTIGWGHQTAHGFVVDTGDSVAILTDIAIEAEKIDEAKAEESRQRAAARLQEKISDEEVASVNASLARSLAQLRVKRRRRT